MRIAVIVPTLNEESTLPEMLATLMPQLEDSDLLVVVDGGSSDATLPLRTTAEVLETGPSRGLQLDTGARRAIERGAEILLFLHADASVPDGLLERLRQLSPAVGGGCLVDFRSASPLLALGQRLVNWRTKRFGKPLGDQGQFASAAAYAAAGGYPHWPILEDTAFIKKLRKLGTLDIVNLAIGTSARRFRERGVLRTVLTNWLIWTLHGFGFSPFKLVRLYRNIR